MSKTTILERKKRLLARDQTVLQHKRSRPASKNASLAQYKTKVQPSFDARTQIVALNNQLTAAGDARDDADKDTVSANQLVVNAVKGDPNYGDDSDLYDAMGYVRRSERASGLTRGKTPAPAASK